MAKKALLIWGGWDGHDPQPITERLNAALQAKGVETEVSNELERLEQGGEDLKQLDLIVITWTMGKITGDQLKPLCEAVRSGVGLAGCHGGLGDAFRDQPEFQFMVGGQWVAHPGGDQVNYTVNITDPDHPITKGLSDFQMTSEQYYLHVDPAVHTLATTNFEQFGAVMPTIWTKTYGEGRVFYNGLGHKAADFDVAENMELMTRGMLWAMEK